MFKLDGDFSSQNSGKIDKPKFTEDESLNNHLDIGADKPNKYFKQDRKKKLSMLNFKSRVIDYIISDCDDTISKSNIDFLVDHNTKEILIKTKNSNRGETCLGFISKGIVEQIASETGVDQYQITIKN